MADSSRSTTLLIAVAAGCSAVAATAAVFITLTWIGPSPEHAVDQSLTGLEQRLTLLENQSIDDRGFDRRSAPAAPPGAAGDEGAPLAGSRPRPFSFGAGASRADARKLSDEDIPIEDRRLLARTMVASGNGSARMAGIRALIELEDETVVAAVRELVEEANADRRSQMMASQAIDGLARSTSPGVDAELYSYLNHDQDQVQLAAARALEVRGDDGPMRARVARLSPGLDSVDPGDRGRTVQALGWTRSASAVAPLLRALDDESVEVRLRAAQALGSTRNPAAIEKLSAALDDPVAAVRSAAERSIDIIRNPDRAQTRMLRFQGG